MVEHRTYVFQGNYGDRTTEANFIKHALKDFNKNTLTGCGIFANNHIYNLQLFIYFVLEREFERFEKFVESSYSSLSRSYNLFNDKMLEDASRRAGNMATFVDDSTVDLIMTDYPNGTFIWPSKKLIDESGVILSHLVN